MKKPQEQHLSDLSRYLLKNAKSKRCKTARKARECALRKLRGN